jgi:hypothetical protein
MPTTVRVLENTPEKRSGTKSLPKVFLHNKCKQIYFILFFCLSHKKMRSGTHLTQQNVFLPGQKTPNTKCLAIVVCIQQKSSEWTRKKTLDLKLQTWVTYISYVGQVRLWIRVKVRVNLEEPGGLPSPTRINLEEPGGLPSPNRITSPTRINLFLCPSVGE